MSAGIAIAAAPAGCSPIWLSADLARTKDGRLMAACIPGAQNNSTGASPVPSDNGSTTANGEPLNWARWSGPLHVYGYDSAEPANASLIATVEAAGAHALALLARPSGALDLLYLQDDATGWKTELRHRLSRDGGATWSSPTVVSAGFDSYGPHSYFNAPPLTAQISDLIAAFNWHLCAAWDPTGTRLLVFVANGNGPGFPAMNVFGGDLGAPWGTAGSFSYFYGPAFILGQASGSGGALQWTNAPAPVGGFYTSLLSSVARLQFLHSGDAMILPHLYRIRSALGRPGGAAMVPLQQVYQSGAGSGILDAWIEEATGTYVAISDSGGRLTGAASTGLHAPGTISTPFATRTAKSGTGPATGQGWIGVWRLCRRPDHTFDVLYPDAALTLTLARIRNTGPGGAAFWG